MTKKREYTYYIELRADKCDTAHANRVVCSALAKGTEGAINSSASTDITLNAICSDRKRHTLYCCPSGLLLMLWSSRDSLAIDFRIFSQEGNGQIRDVTEWYKKRHQKRETHSYGKF
jgi:hypothetical protein